MVSIGTPSHDVAVRVGPLVNLPRVVSKLGLDPKPLFRQFGLELGHFQDPENRLPFVRTGDLIAHCASATGADHLGLLVGQMAGPSHLGLPGFLAQSAPTVEVGLHALANNLDLHDQGGFTILESDTKHSSLSYNVVEMDVAGMEQVYDLSATMLYSTVRALCGKKWKAESVSIGRRPPEDSLPYQAFFKTQIYFNAVESSVTFDNRWLSATPPHSDNLLFHHLSNEATDLHATITHELIDELPSCLYTALLAGQFSSRHVATRLGIHERTLHRRLQTAGTSFRAQLDRARQGLSERLLSTTTLPVCDIATSLGYADSSGFIRAFQRWSGVSPCAWRRQNGTLENRKSG